MPETTLLDEAGGQRRIDKVTSNFYERVMEDPRVSYLFLHVDVEALTIKLAKTVGWLLGGEERIFHDSHGEEIGLPAALRLAHGKLMITPKQYDIVCNFYMMSLHEAQVPFKVCAAIGQKLVEVEPYVVFGSERKSV